MLTCFDTVGWVEPKGETHRSDGRLCSEQSELTLGGAPGGRFICTTFVARMERCAAPRNPGKAAPDFASLHPGYGC